MAFSKEQKRIAFEMHAQGATLYQIAKKVGKSHSSVKYILKQAAKKVGAPKVEKETKTSTAAPLNQEGGGFDAAMSAVKGEDVGGDKSSETVAAPTPPAGLTADGLISLIEIGNTITCKIYCSVHAIRLEPEIERQLAFTSEEKDALKSLAPSVLPFLDKFLGNTPMVGGFLFAATVIGIEAQRFAIMKQFRPKKMQQGADSKASPAEVPKTVVETSPPAAPSSEKAVPQAEVVSPMEVSKFFPPAVAAPLSDDGERFDNPQHFPQ